MPKFPEPPSAAELAKLSPVLHTLGAGTLLWRIHFRAGSHPTAWNELRAWGPTNSRFDHQLPPAGVSSRGIIYLAEFGDTCFAEVFQTTRTIDVLKDAPWLVAFKLDRDVFLLDLTGPWPTQAGASAAINSGPRPRARRWSRTIYQAYPKVEGLLYASSMDGNRPAQAFYERAKTAIPATLAFERALGSPTLKSIVENAAARFGYAVV